MKTAEAKAPADSVTYRFSSPIEHKGLKVTELTFGLLLWGEVEDAEGETNMNAVNRTLLAAMSGQDADFFRKVPARDLMPMMKAVAPLMGNEQDMAGLFDQAKAKP